ncbi:MAG: ATP-binding cassette domain-containing protein [Lachnospiraceae bacterium]
MIEVNGLKKRYQDFCLDISLHVPAGTVCGIVGKNGAGKSTTIKSILGLVKPDEGEIRVLGKNIGELTVKDKEQLGTALADSGFSPELNVEDTIAVLKKMYQKFDEKFFREECGRQNIPLNKKMREFSTGMKAKVRVLSAVSHGARLLIMDEPTAGLDVVARKEVMDILRNFLQQDPETSILISSHISSDLEGLCDDIYFIHDGKVILHEDTDRILGNYGVLRVSSEDFARLDKQYLLCTTKESFGFVCLTKEKMYYRENYPDIVVENCKLDDVILLMLGGK